MQKQDVLVQGECDHHETSKPSRRRPEVNSVENFECPPLPGRREGILVGTRRLGTPPNVVGSVVEEGEMVDPWMVSRAEEGQTWHGRCVGG